MPRRTIAEARRMLDENAATLNPPTYRDFDNEIKEHERDVRTRAESYVGEIYDRHAATGQATGEGLCTIRDHARTLTADLRAGRITAAEGAKRWNELRAQARRLNSTNTNLRAEADRLAAIEQDVVAWYDETIHAKYPDLRPDFTF